MDVYDVAILGAGPAGLIAAGQAGQRGKNVILIEKNKKVGRKLDITGGGRCNITNATFDNREMLANYGDKAKFLHSVFAQHSVSDTFKFFNQLGIEIVEQARGRCFPASEHAPDVTNALRKFVNSTGKVENKLATFIQQVTIIDNLFVIKTNNGVFRAHKVIFATGSTSHPETGSTGEAFEYLKFLGHTIEQPNPNLVPLQVVESELTGSVSGTSLTFMKISFWQNGKVQFSETGKVLFTHFGLSGPLILNSSYRVIELLKKGEVKITIDMYPDTEFDQLDRNLLISLEANSNKLFKNVLPSLVPKGMMPLFLKKITAEILETPAHTISKETRRRLTHDLKSLELTAGGTMNEDWAIIADGGVPLNEIDTKTMESRLCPGLYIIGDCLHINRPTGGYSLQLCWSTGYVAGIHV